MAMTVPMAPLTSPDVGSEHHSSTVQLGLRLGLRIRIRVIEFNLVVLLANLTSGSLKV